MTDVVRRFWTRAKPLMPALACRSRLARREGRGPRVVGPGPSEL